MLLGLFVFLSFLVTLATIGIVSRAEEQTVHKLLMMLLWLLVVGSTVFLQYIEYNRM